MKKPRAWPMIALGALLVATLIGVVLTRETEIKQSAASVKRASAWRARRMLVDQQPLRTAQAMAAAATEREERRYTFRALRTADDSVDLAFATALRNAEFHPTPPNPEMQALAAHVKEVQQRIAADQADIARLTAESAKKQDLDTQQQLELAQAQLSLDQEELADSQQDLIRAGGDVHSTIKRLLDEHEATHAAMFNQQNAAPVAETWTLASHFASWRRFRARLQDLKSAEAEAAKAAASLDQAHDQLEASLKQQVIPKPGTPGANTTAAIAAVRARAADEKTLSEYDKRIQDETELADTYREWQNVIAARQRASLHGMLIGLALILVICLAGLTANQFLHKLDAALPPDRRSRRSVHFIARFALQVIALLLILMVVLGTPGQLTTILGLAGAGLTVALKDFIVAFFGWFVLMGKNGVRVGDWVEINGIGGEVVELGVLRTVLLETGKWNDAGHPTGRKVTFVNSYAIEGHFFNFSTTGQWLWDELEVLVPASEDPYPVVKAIQELVTKATEENARLAEKEWQRLASSHALQSFTAAPAVDVKPTNLGVVIVVRYITRAHERHELRTRLYRAIVELLRSRNIPQASGAAISS